MKTKFGFDEAFNYKEEKDYDACLKRYICTLQGPLVYIDNICVKTITYKKEDQDFLGNPNRKKKNSEEEEKFTISKSSIR